MATGDFLRGVEQAMRLHKLAKRTRKTYLQWMEKFIRFHRMTHPEEMGKAEVEAFLNAKNRRACCLRTRYGSFSPCYKGCIIRSDCSTMGRDCGDWKYSAFECGILISPNRHSGRLMEKEENIEWRRSFMPQSRFCESNSTMPSMKRTAPHPLEDIVALWYFP